VIGRNGTSGFQQEDWIHLDIYIRLLALKGMITVITETVTTHGDFFDDLSNQFYADVMRFHQKNGVSPDARDSSVFTMTVMTKKDRP
jgi:hypothetical protein